MPDIYDSVPGTVVVMPDPSLQGVTPLFSMRNTPITFQQQKSLITRVTVAQQANYQFVHALGGDIYVYVFGDRIGQMTVNGIAGSRTCQGDDGRHGFEHTLDWYKKYKISAASQTTPLALTIGNTTLKGFLVGMNGSVLDPKMYLMEFSMAFMLLPED